MMRVWIFGALAASACAAPTTPTTPVPPAMITISGRLLATQTQTPLSATLDFNGSSLNTSGAFSFTIVPSGTLPLTIRGANILTRNTFLGAAVSHDVSLDAIALDGFDLNFYRQLVRNGFEEPTSLQPLRRWTKAPNLYIRTVDESGALIVTSLLDATEATLRETLPRWTPFSFASVTRGAETREGQAGWLTVKWPATNTGHCGLTQVGQEGGWMELHYKTPACACGTLAMRPGTVRHELGHAMGFYHTDTANDLMFGASGLCDRDLSARESLMAKLAYLRPVGNKDPDSDPSNQVFLSPMVAK